MPALSMRTSSTVWAGRWTWCQLSQRLSVTARCSFALLVMMGFFLSQALQDYFNVHLSWWVSALITCAIIQYAGFKNIEVSGRILGTLMVGEILVMLIFDIAVVGHGGGPEGLSSASFAPRTVMGPGFGAAVVFIIAYYTGF